MENKSVYLEIIALLNAKQFSEAATLAQAGVLTDEEYMEYLADAHFYRGEQQQAIDAYDLLFSKYPDSKPARYYYLIGVKMERDERFSDAFSYYRSAVEAEPTFVDSYIELGGLLYKAKDYEGAVKCLERALEFDPNDIRIYRNLKILYAILAKQKPDDYSSRKERLDSDYTRLEKELKPLPSGYQW